MPRTLKTRTVMVIAVAAILMGSAIYFLVSRGIHLLDSELGSGYQSESHSYNVKAGPGTFEPFVLLLPYPQLVVDEVRPVKGNASFVQYSSEHGRCLNVSGSGSYELDASGDSKAPLNAGLKYWKLNLTMTNGSSPMPGRQSNITAWVWSGADNISLELTFSAGHSTYNPAAGKGAAGEGYYDQLNCTLREGWQCVAIERHWWVT